MRPHRILSLTLALAVVSPAVAVAQPKDPYSDDNAPTPPPNVTSPDDAPPAGTVDDKDPEVAEAIAASLVERAKSLMQQEEWGDAQQLLTEALVESPDGASSVEAKQLLDQVNAKLGISTTTNEPADPYATDDGGPGVGDYIEPPPTDQYMVPPPESPTARAGRKFMLHTAVMGAFIGGFIGDAATADLQPMEVDGDPVGAKSSGGVIAGTLVGGLGGLAIGAGFRHSHWMTGGDIATIDSFAAFGMLGALGLGGVMKPAASEAYSVNAAVGTITGAVTGLYLAKRHAFTSKRMRRVDLWAGLGALTPWAVFALAKGDKSGAQVAGFFSMAGLVGGAWLGFRLTRHWNSEVDVSGRLDAPVVSVSPTNGGAALTVAGQF
jgi:hypothetical protein